VGEPKFLFKRTVFGKGSAISAFEEEFMVISSRTGIVSIAELSEGCSCVRLGWTSWVNIRRSE
jgi:hypothetical protein